MPYNLFQLSYLVNDYDQAIQYFTDKLSFKLKEDTPLENGKRWVIIGPSDDTFNLLLAKVANEEQQKALGKQAGDRVFIFLRTDDFWTDYKQMQEKGVHFEELPREEPYGTVVVFRDLYGNKWDLIQHN